MAICYPLSACNWLQNEWPRITLSAYFMSKSVFDQQCCHALTFALARLFCLSCSNFGIFRDETKIVTCSLLLPLHSSRRNRWPGMTTNGHFTLNYAFVQTFSEEVMLKKSGWLKRWFSIYWFSILSVAVCLICSRPKNYYMIFH